MSRHKTFNELSEVTITVRAIDRNGAVFSPDNARYRLDDLDSKTAIIAWTTLTPSTSMTITIPAASNAMQNANNAEEVKVLTVETNHGKTTAHPEEYKYKLKNLAFVS